MFRHSSIYMTDETKKELEFLGFHYNSSKSGVIRKLIHERYEGVRKRMKQVKASVPKVTSVEAKERENDKTEKP